MNHINRFIDKIKMSESKQLKKIELTIKEARDLHADITKLLLVLQELQEPPAKSDSDEVQKVEIDGGKW